MKCTLQQVIELTKIIAEEDKLDWATLATGKEEVYQMIGSQVYELYGQWAQSEDKEAVVLATITKLVIENFLLNLQLQSLKE